jgi:hypothetical protein
LIPLKRQGFLNIKRPMKVKSLKLFIVAGCLWGNTAHAHSSGLLGHFALPADTVPDLTEQTESTDVLRLPDGRTVEVDMYEEFTFYEDASEEETRRKSDKACVTPFFAGKVRKLAKTTPHSGGRARSFSSIADFLEWLPSDSSMKYGTPIDRSENSARVPAEQRNIILKKVWLLAVYRERDNDFHLILCDKQVYDGEAALFSAEISGLPDSPNVSPRTMSDLEDARRALTDKLGDLNCGRTYIFKKGGLPVKVRGSLFFDIHHAGHKHGRQGLYPQSAWELHPVTDLIWLDQE